MSIGNTPFLARRPDVDPKCYITDITSSLFRKEEVGLRDTAKQTVGGIAFAEAKEIDRTADRKAIIKI